MNEQIKAIRAEIERLKEPHERNLKKPMERGRIGYAHGCVDCCDRILDFIDSLPEETDNEEPSCPKESDDLEEKAEEYAKQYARESIPEDADGEIWKVGDVMIENQISFEDGFIAGAEWQTRKMMEEAVEAEVADLNGELYNRCVECGLTDLDKVKIIIVKEDKQ